MAADKPMSAKRMSVSLESFATVIDTSIAQTGERQLVFACLGKLLPFKGGSRRQPIQAGSSSHFFLYCSGRVSTTSVEMSAAAII